MEYLIIAIIFLFGLIIGSFLNVVILRFDTGMSVVHGRSACFHCGKTLSWHELIPVWSFAKQKGKCKGCSSKISWQYPLVELLGGFAFVIAYLVTRDALVDPRVFVEFLVSAALLCIYIVIGVYDMRHKIIPDRFSYAAAAVALGLIAVRWGITGNLDVLALLAGPALFIFFWFFWFVSKGTWMGLGDGKLALSIGFALGFTQGVAAVLFAFWSGAVISLCIIAVQSVKSHKKHGDAQLGLKSQIPFGPFLILGYVLAYVGHVGVEAIFNHLAL